MEYTIEGLKEFEAAIRRNPDLVRRKARQFIADGLTVYKTSIMRNPWTLRSSGGGAPTATKALRDTHKTEIGDFEGRITPTASYAPYVIEGTYKMESRDYLEYAKETKDSQIKQLEQKLLQDLIVDLAK